MMSPERIRLLIANFTLVGVYSTPIIFLFTVLCRHAWRINQSARSVPQPISVGSCFNEPYYKSELERNFAS